MSERTIEGIRYTLDHGYYDKQGEADVALLLGRLDAQLADLRTIENYLDWKHAIDGYGHTLEFHRQLVFEERPWVSLVEAREAMKRLKEAAS